MIAPPRRSAFTLVELLVVAGLLSAFLGMMMVGLRPNDGSQTRQLAQSLSSAILAAQTRALGNETGAALILEASAGAVSTNAVFNGDVPPFITGTVASGMPPTSLSSNSAAVTLTPLNADATDLASGFRIRFLGPSQTSGTTMSRTAWMGFSDAGTVSFRTAAGQSIHNTVWPVAPLSSSLGFEIARFPVKSTQAFDVLKRAAIDLRYSGVGNAVTGDYGSLNGKGSIAVTFDRLGSLDTVILLGLPAVEPLSPAAPLYLLVASLTDIDANTSLRSQGSRWLAITPGSGRVNVAANVTVSGTTQNDIDTARSLARQAATTGVK